MGRDDPAIREITSDLTAYLDRLRAHVDVEGVVVFGSRARNEGFVDSDLDVAVVSRTFHGMSRLERMMLLLADWQGSVALEALGFTPDELLACDRPIVWSILHEGLAWEDRGPVRQAQARLQQKITRGDLEPLADGWREGPDT